MVQEVPITQNSANLNIVLPAGSMITSILLFVNTIWSGASTGINVGFTSPATELAIAADNLAAALGILNITPGTNAARLLNWQNVGATDVRIWVLSANVGTGAGRLVVRYAQAIQDS